jgi:membrane protein YdbS with pleckstrin-like domain
MTHRKPLRNAFLFRALVAPILFLLVIAVGAGVGGVVSEVRWVALAAAGAWVAVSAWICVVSVAQFRKERYEVHADRIVVHRGGLLSDEELEVHYANITHVKWIRPWLSHKLFGVGDVYIEVAGSGAGAISFRSIADSDEAQAEIRRHMQQAFSMSTDELLHEEGPSGIGILIDVPVKSAWAIMFGAIMFGAELAPLLQEAAEAGIHEIVSLDWLMQHVGWLLLAIPIGAIAAAFTTLRCLDLKRRTYRVYNGVIEYHEGFLTRNDAFMPVENLSNSEVTRGVVERITNLYHVVVSCQGAGQEVSFLYLRRGPELNAVLDKLIDQAEVSSAVEPAVVALTDSAATGETAADEIVNEVIGEKEALPPPLPREVTCPDLTYRMHIGRSLVPMLIYLIFIPLLIFAPYVLIIFAYQIGMRVIRIIRTTYTLRRSSVEERFAFVRVEQREFSREKITGVVFRENLIDRMFKTVTIQFWSIGAGKEIMFRNVRKTDELFTAVRERTGVTFDAPVDTIQSEHGLGRYLGANLIGHTILVSLAIVTVAGAVYMGEPLYGLLAVPLLIGPILGYVWGVFFYRTSTLELHEQGMIFRRGIINRVETRAAYSNVKDISTLKIPGYDAGAMRFNVAGERSIGNAGGGGGIPYGVTMRYVPELKNKDELFDYDILARGDVPASQEDTYIEARKAWKNTLAATLLFCIIVFPLIVLLPIILPIALYRASLVRYRIEPGRVLMQRGRMFRQQTSILFSRIDHIQTGRGALNKLFGNGNITISTAGSSRPELVLSAVVDHEDFYRALQEHHRAEPEIDASITEESVLSAHPEDVVCDDSQDEIAEPES